MRVCEAGASNAGALMVNASNPDALMVDASNTDAFMAGIFMQAAVKKR